MARLRKKTAEDNNAAKDRKGAKDKRHRRAQEHDTSARTTDTR